MPLPAKTTPSPSPPQGRVPPALDHVAAWLWRLLPVVAAVVAVAWLARRLLLLVVALGAAVLLTALLQPLVNWLSRHGWSRVAATWLVLVSVLGAVVAFAWWLAPRVADQLTGIGPEVSRAVESARSWLTTGPLGLERDQVDQLRDRALALFGMGGDAGLASRFVSGAQTLVLAVAGVLLTVVLTFFFVKDGPAMARWAAEHLGDGRRRGIERMASAAWAAVGAYLRGVSIIAAFNAVASAIAYAVIGVPLVLALATLEFFASFVPLVGAVTVGALAAAVALASGGLVDALLVVGVAVAIEQVEGNFLQPVVLGRAVKLHPVVVIVVVTAGALLAGIVGAVLAVPLAAAVSAAAGAAKHE